MNTITFSWDAVLNDTNGNPANIIRYKVYKNAGQGGGFVFVGDVIGTDTQIVLPNQAPGTYMFYVVAENAQGSSTPSDINRPSLVIAAVVLTVPAQPQNVVATLS